jgi:hypothetical protein
MDLYHRFKDRFGAAGVLVGVIALVIALVTGAYAAGGGLSGKQRKEVAKIARKEAQKYANSNPDIPGEKGPKGDPGANGTNGKDGVSVTFSPASEAACPAGGSVFGAANGETTICNGKDGTFSTEPLPSGETLTGVWGLEISPQFIEEEPRSGELGLATISYPIRVSPAPTKLIWVKAGGSPGLVVNPANGAFLELIEEAEEVEALCPGSPADPQAVAGILCMYTAFEEGATYDIGFFGHPHRATSPDPSSGALFPFVNTEGEPALISGSWAVMAE